MRARKRIGIQLTWDDLKATAEERLVFFEHVALQRKQESGLTVK